MWQVFLLPRVVVLLHVRCSRLLGSLRVYVCTECGRQSKLDLLVLSTAPFFQIFTLLQFCRAGASISDDWHMVQKRLLLRGLAVLLCRVRVQLLTMARALWC